MDSVRWEDAIRMRRSIRSFKAREVDDDTLSKLRRFAADIEAPFEHHVTIKFFKADLSLNLIYALDLARMAPSGGNTQHWRFHVSPGLKNVSISKPVGYKHFKWEHADVDIGICACHFWLGLRLKEVHCDVTLTVEDDRAVWQFRL